MDDLKVPIEKALSVVLEDVIKEANNENITSLDTNESVFRIANFGPSAKGILERLRTLARESKSERVRIWIIGAMACIDEDIISYARCLLKLMYAADEESSRKPEVKTSELDDDWESDIDDALDYIDAWSAGSPAMDAQESLKKVIQLIGPRITPILEELKYEFPKQVHKIYR